MSLNLPYVSLRAFETVARLRGFGRAGEELNVTQSAVSQHIKTLEEWTGHQLLVRGPRETLPTPEGQELADAVHRGLGLIEDVCSRLKTSADADLTLVLSCPPGFAINWLFPRLLRFDLKFPQYPVSIATQSGPLELASGSVDAAIHYGPGGYSGLNAQRLMNERIFPVAAPKLAEGSELPSDISELAQHTLLVDDLSLNAGSPPTWEYWADALGVDPPRGKRRRRFGQSNLVVQAARQGLGIALGREPLVIDALCAGELMRPFPQTVVSEYSYWLVSPKRRSKSQSLDAFSAWLMEETAAQPDLPKRKPQATGDAHVRMD